MLGLVFTDEVLDAALGSSTISRETYLNSILTCPCAFLSGQQHFSGLLKPLEPVYSVGETGQQKFKAKFLQDFAGAKEGEVTSVKLDLLSNNPSIHLKPRVAEPTAYPVQLLLGTGVSTPEDLAAVMHSNLTA